MKTRVIRIANNNGSYWRTADRSIGYKDLFDLPIQTAKRLLAMKVDDLIEVELDDAIDTEETANADEL